MFSEKLFGAFPPNLIKRSLTPENIRTKPPASLRPKGSLSPLKGTIATKATSCQVAGGLTQMQLGLLFFTQKDILLEKEDKIMTTDILDKEIRALPSEYISQVEKFVLYLKLKMEFGKIERDMNETLNRKESFLDALKGWRQGCSSDDDFSKDLEAGRVVEYPDASKANIWG